MATVLICITACQGERVGYWSPTYKDLNEVWREVKLMLFDVIKDKNEQVKQLVLVTGGVIDFWSMDDPDSGRGRKYHRAVIDEFEKAKKGEQAWKQTIRPTLTDFKGDAWILSTPKGLNTFFCELSKYAQEFENWAYFHMPTVSNPYIDPDEVEDARKTLDPITFAQEYEAKFVSTANKPFLYCFEDRHISTIPTFNPALPMYISFDFNVDPATALLWQEPPNAIHFIDEVYLNNSNVYEVCDALLTKYPNAFYHVTGDKTGKNRHHMQKGNTNSYTIIKKELMLKDTQLFIKGKNPPVNESRTLANSILAHHPEVLFHERCVKTIEDCRFTQVKDDGSIDKTTNAHMSHLLDNVRYAFHLNHNNFIRKIEAYK